MKNRFFICFPEKSLISYIMEEILCHGYRYRFILLNRTFTAIFDKIESPMKQLFVTEYQDENGKYPGTRTMPFSWVRSVELVSIPEENDIEIIDVSTPPTKKKRRTKSPKMVNNFTN